MVQGLILARCGYLGWGKRISKIYGWEESLCDMKKLIEREIGSLTFSANQTATLQLPRDYSIDKLQFRFMGTLYRAAGASAGAPKDLSFAQLIKRIEIRRNGRDVLKSIDFETLMRLNQLRYGTQPAYRRTVYNARFGEGAVVTTQWDGYAAVTTGANAIDFDLSAIMDFGMWNAIRRNDTLLDATARGNVSTLDMIVTFGAYNDVMSVAYNPAAGGVAADRVPVLYVSTSEYIDVNSQEDPYTPYSDNKEYGIRKVITATNPKELIELGPGNFFRSIVLKTYSDDGQINDLINAITLRSGTDVIKYRTGKALRWDNKQECGLETMPDGYFLLEFVKDGHLAKMLDTTNMSSLTLELDIVKRGTIDVVEVFPVEVVPASRRVA